MTKLISKVEDKTYKEKLNDKLKAILATEINDQKRRGGARKYEDLIRGGFNLDQVTRIERTNYVNSIYGKTGDLTFETIDKLIKEGECDAWFSLILRDTDSLELDSAAGNEIRGRLLNTLHKAQENFKEKGYEDNNSQTYQMLAEFIEIVRKNTDIINKLNPDRTDRLAEMANGLIDGID